VVDEVTVMRSGMRTRPVGELAPMLACGLVIGTAVGEEGSPPLGNNAPLVRVVSVSGAPTFTVDARPFAVPCFETYAPEEKYYRQFAASGVKLFSFNANAAACDYGHSKPTWTAPETWDYSGFDERADRVLAADPHALLLPRVNLGTPRWWLTAHPDDLEVLDGGGTLYRQPNINTTIPKDRPFPSLASPLWRRDIGDALRRLVRHIQTSKYADHVFGYMLTGLDTEEWYHWSSGSHQLAGYSRHTRRAFQEWLRRRYGDVASLRLAWSRPDITFDTVEVPSRCERYDAAAGTFRDPTRAMNVIDFYLFYNDLVPETIDSFARIVREETGGRQVIGAFYAYMYEFRGDPEYGHNALGRLNSSANLDFVMVTSSYGYRSTGTGGEYERAPSYSVRLHGKLWYHDNDVISFLAPQVLRRVGFGDQNSWETNLQHHLSVLGYAGTVEGTRWMYRRSLGFALCHGMYQSYFDLHGGYYDHPELMAEVARLNRVAQASLYYDRSSVSEVLIVADEASCAYATYANPMVGDSLLSPQPALIKMGAPADHILLDDLERLNTDRYKLAIVLNAYHLSDDQRGLIRRKLLGSGRWVLWCYAPGTFNGSRRSVEGMRELTGLRIVPSEDTGFAAPRVQVLRGASPLSKRLERLADSPMGPQGKICSLFRVEDPSAVALGVLPGSSQVTLAMKAMSDWTSLYAVTPSLPPTFYRELARAAGVHIYNDRDDTLYANASFITLHANGAGQRTLRIPRPGQVVDIVEDKMLASRAAKLSLDLQHGQTLLLRWAPTPTTTSRPSPAP